MEYSELENHLLGYSNLRDMLSNPILQKRRDGIFTPSIKFSRLARRLWLLSDFRGTFRNEFPDATLRSSRMIIDGIKN